MTGLCPLKIRGSIVLHRVQTVNLILPPSPEIRAFFETLLKKGIGDLIQKKLKVMFSMILVS